jgi:hypothetical protein
MFIADCPRCGQSRTTFDVLADVPSVRSDLWDPREVFLRCRSCGGSSIGLLTKKTSGIPEPTQIAGHFIDAYYRLAEWVFKIPSRRTCPQHVPDDVQRIFNEAASCLAIQCWDAAGSMFRKTLDVTTRSKISTPDADISPKAPNWKTYKDLRLRLDHLFQSGLLDRSLEDLSSCIHQDGNDAAHDEIGIGPEEAEDLADFTERVLEIVYTIPGQINENKRRREYRRASSNDAI